MAYTKIKGHYANMSVQYTAIFHSCKSDNFQMKIFDIFLIFAQNIDCGYTLESPQRGGSNEYPQSMFWSKNKKKYVYPSKPHFFYIKVGCNGVFITRTCYPDVLINHFIQHKPSMFFVVQSPRQGIQLRMVLVINFFLLLYPLQNGVLEGILFSCCLSVFPSVRPSVKFLFFLNILKSQ